MQQQKGTLSTTQMNMVKPVREVFWQDFWECVDKWMAQGEHLIIGGDWNQDVCSNTFLKPF